MVRYKTIGQTAVIRQGFGQTSVQTGPVLHATSPRLLCSFLLLLPSACPLTACTALLIPEHLPEGCLGSPSFEILTSCKFQVGTSQSLEGCL